MEYKNIIIILLIIIIILLAGLGAILLNQTHAKEPTKIKITSDKEQFEGGELSVILTDLNETAISNQTVNITVTDSEGKAVKENAVKTDSKGEAKLNLDLKKGNYSVNITYGGNEKYAKNNTTQKLTIKEAVTTSASSSSSKSSDTPYDINNLPPTNDPYPETKRYYIDEYTVKQEYADGYMRSVDIRTGQIYSHGFR